VDNVVEATELIQACWSWLGMSGLLFSPGPGGGGSRIGAEALDDPTLPREVSASIVLVHRAFSCMDRRDSGDGSFYRIVPETEKGPPPTAIRVRILHPGSR